MNTSPLGASLRTADDVRRNAQECQTFVEPLLQGGGSSHAALWTTYAELPILTKKLFGCTTGTP